MSPQRRLADSFRLLRAAAAYVLAFSVIMLNTDAHSNQIVNKMTQEEFLRNNRGIGERTITRARMR